MAQLNLQEIITRILSSFLEQLPSLFFILVIFLIGCLVAFWLGKLATRILKKMHVDHLFKKNSWKQGLEKSGIKSGLSDAAGWVVRWILIILFMAMAIEALGFSNVAAFLMSVVRWLPNLLIAILIFISAAILTDMAGNVIRISIDWIDSSYAFIAEKISRWAIWGLAILVILKQVGIAPEMTIILFQGLIYFLVLSFGLAFGLGGQEVARDFLRSLQNKIKKKQE